MTPPIAIVGMACRYPDANGPVELWENVLAQRRAFRRLPPERLRIEDYFAADRSVPDASYSVEAALIEGYEFDRVKFKTAGSTYRAADLSHWLALDVAAQALADAGYPDGQGLPRESTGVLLANTLTGEFARASLMRYRWPYVRRMVEAGLREEGWASEAIVRFLGRLEGNYKAPFAPVGEESLAGGLSNTIAGRICNHFDLKGGGYTVDGACASSLLAVATGCSALVSGDLDVALAGGVDLSLDPFELVGFAKAGALASEEMRVYDARSAGFWPGEGCGFVVLMRHEDALAVGLRVYALIRGWGISSDGSGGMTRPEEAGQWLALQRAYQRAGFSAASPAYFEGHGTGTTVGDSTELRVLVRARREAGATQDRAGVGSIKANIGHAKAAAGLAGLIKATLAVQRQVLPPNTGCERPHPELLCRASPLRVLPEAEPWPEGVSLRAGVSSMGFGGINAHVVLDGDHGSRRRALSARERRLQRSPQDGEVFLFAAPSAAELLASVRRVSEIAARLSRAELTDVAAHLASELGEGPRRAAVLANRPAELAGRLATLEGWLGEGIEERFDLEAGIILGHRRVAPRIGFLFPGQGSPVNPDGGVYRRRFDAVADLYRGVEGLAGASPVATQVAQPAIARASLAGLRVLTSLGIEASVAVGHSLGELTALHWGGALNEAALLRVAAARGQAMAELGSPTGAMAGIEAGALAVQGLVEGTPVVIAGLNSPRQTVISGPAAEVTRVVELAQERGLRGTRLPVSHAFHSTLVAAAGPALAARIAAEDVRPLTRRVVSTITGLPLASDADLRELLLRQLTSPVRFVEAATCVLEDCGLLIEVGPGQVLGGLVRQFGENGGSGPWVVSLDAAGPSLRGLLAAVGAAHALGAPVRCADLFADRHCKPFTFPWKPKFFANPCEQAPLPGVTLPARAEPAAGRDVRPSLAQSSGVNESAGADSPAGPTAGPTADRGPSILELVRRLVAARAELPVEAVLDESRLLGDLHLNSISVGQLVAEAAQQLGLAPLVNLNDFATATVEGVARALDELARTGVLSGGSQPEGPIDGVDSWVRPFAVDFVESAAAPAPRGPVDNDWRVIAPPDHPEARALGERLRDAGDGRGRAAAETAGAVAAGGRAPGIVVWLPPGSPAAQVPPLLEAARAVLSRPEGARLVVVQEAPGGAAFARTLYLEEPRLRVAVVTVPGGLEASVEWVMAEALSGEGYSEARYDGRGVRYQPRLRLLERLSEGGPMPLNGADLLLITGGGKGIAAECGLALARRTGVRLLLCGRSRPEADAELAANLERFTAAGVQWRYVVADVTDAAAVQAALRGARETMGPVTAVLHGAGTNVPQLIASLEEAAVHRTLGPKVDGLRNVLAALDAGRLRLLVTFSSIIGRAGLRGEADYALANEWLTRLTEEFGQEHPACRCLALEWSVWSGVGMGQRLGRIDQLLGQGITPITPDEGVETLCRLMATPGLPVALVVSGRFGELPTLPFERPDLPFRRFLEKPRVWYPGLELIVDVRVADDTDPYLAEHVFREERLLPAVLGLEAMAQVAMASIGAEGPPRFEDVRWQRPIVAGRDGSTVLRVAALVRRPGEVEVALRCSQTGYQVDHFRGTCRFTTEGSPPAETTFRPDRERSPQPRGEVALEVATQVYGPLLFHTGRFRRIQHYAELRARECEVVFTKAEARPWFGPYLPPELVLGDPGVRDAGVHAIQACIPHARLLPVGVKRIDVARGAGGAGDGMAVRAIARERWQQGDEFTYDLRFLDDAGRAVEVWTELRLRRVEALALPEAWPVALLANHLTRRAEEWFPTAELAVALESGMAAAAAPDTSAMVRRLFPEAPSLHYRPDGKPELIAGFPEAGAQLAGRAVSAAHAAGFTLVVTARGTVGCDLETVTGPGGRDWLGLLGGERLTLAERVSREAGEALDVSATRIWAARESLKKAGLRDTTGLQLEPGSGEGWVLLRAGRHLVATYQARLAGLDPAVVIGLVALPGNVDVPVNGDRRGVSATASFEVGRSGG